MTRVSPSILSADFSRLGEEIARTDKAGADWIHLDVMDGMFVPNITFGPPVIKAVRGYSDRFFDAHLMIDDPVRYIDAFADAGCDAITVHCEAEGDIHAAVQKIKEKSLKVGISVNPETPIERLVPFLDRADLVLIMTVHPGFGGQSFISDCVPKISFVSEWAESHGKELAISVDGGINDDTARICVEAGANVLVAGSFLFKKTDMAPTIAEWQRLGPNKGCRDGSESIPHRRSDPHRAPRPPREDRRSRRLQHHIPIPLHNKAARREAPVGRPGKGDIPPLRTPLQNLQSHRERNRTLLRLRREAQRAQGRNHRGAHRPQGEGEDRIRAGPGRRRHEEGVLQGAADLQDDPRDPCYIQGAPHPHGHPRHPGTQRRRGAGRIHVRQGRCVRIRIPGFRFPPIRSPPPGEKPHRLQQAQGPRQEHLQDRDTGSDRLRQDAPRPGDHQGAAGGCLHHDRHGLQPRSPPDRSEEGSETHTEARHPREGHRGRRLRHPRLRRSPRDIPPRPEVGGLRHQTQGGGRRRRPPDDDRLRILGGSRQNGPEQDGIRPQGGIGQEEAEVPGRLVPIAP